MPVIYKFYKKKKKKKIYKKKKKKKTLLQTSEIFLPNYSTEHLDNSVENDQTAPLGAF